MKLSSEQATSRRKGRDSEAGLTLLEMLIVLAIVALLGALIAPNVMRYLGQSKIEVAEAQMSSIATSLELFYLDVGRYPDVDEEGLAALVEAPDDLESWQGPYFRDASGLVDPWGRPYGYALQPAGNRFTLTSLGADGATGGDGENGDLTRS